MPTMRGLFKIETLPLSAAGLDCRLLKAGVMQKGAMFSGKTCGQIRSWHYPSPLNMVIFYHRWLLCLRKTQFCGVGWFRGFKHEAVLAQMRDSQTHCLARPGEREAGRDAEMEEDVMPLVGAFCLKLSDVNISLSAYIQCR